MDIEDILQKKEYKALDDFLNEEMEKYAGKEIMDQMVKVFGEKKARRWFYTESFALGGKRPYDYCKDGKTDSIKGELTAIEYGDFA